MLKNLLVAGLILSTFCTPANAQVSEDAAKKADFVNIMLTEHSYADAQIVGKLFTFNISPSFWAELNKANQSNSNDIGHVAVHALVEEVVNYAKRDKLGDMDALRVFDKSKEKENRPEVDDIINKLKSKFSLVINAPMECRGKGYEMFLRYPYQALNRIGSTNPEWSPASGEAHFVVTLTTDAKDMSVKTSNAGQTYTITGPAYTEAYDTQGKIEKGLNLTNKNN
ncbi:hypothetical protein BH11CYA1_BH11CYA1_33030 [soil metagenome]